MEANASGGLTGLLLLALWTVSTVELETHSNIPNQEATMDGATITSLRGLAIKGVMARPAGNHETLMAGHLREDRLTLMYGSQRVVQVSPRKRQRVHAVRLVHCERRWNDEGDDFWWYGVEQNVLSHTG